MRIFLLISLFTLMQLLSTGQGGLARVELLAEKETDVYTVIPCDEAGTLVLYETADILDAENKKWLFMFYDKDLYPVWEQEVPVVLGAGIQAYQVNGDRLYLFFLNVNRVRGVSDNFQVISLFLGSKDMMISKGFMTSNSNIVDFRVSDNIAIAGLNTASSEGEVYFIHLNTGSVYKSVINLSEQNVIQHIMVDSIHPGVDVVVANYVGKKQNAMLIFSLDMTGEIVNSLQVDPVLEEKYLNSARLVQVGEDKKLLLGSYNSLQGKLPDDNSYVDEPSAGFFSVVIKDGLQTSINYYNFLEFNNIRAGVSSKDFYKMQKRMRKEGSEYSMNYSLLYHDIVRKDDEYLLLAESYFPDYKTVSDISYDYWGRPIPQSYTVFDGFKYINGILASFDAKGNLLWDNSLEIYNITTYQLAPRVGMLFDDDVIVLYYNEGGKITYKAVSKDNAVTGLLHTELKAFSTADQVFESGYDNMVHWYQDYFLCYGYQRIRNASLENPKRTVFYFSKVQFE